MTEKIRIHLESLIIEKPDNWDEITIGDKWHYMNTQICLIQSSVNDWEIIEIKEREEL